MKLLKTQWGRAQRLLRSTTRIGRFSGVRRTPLAGKRHRHAASFIDLWRLGHKAQCQDRRQSRERRQGRSQIVRRQAKLADMLRQAIILIRHMLDRMRPARQLGEEECENEKEMAQGSQSNRLIHLDEQAFEVFAFRKVQCHRVICSAGQATNNARLASGINGSRSDDFLKQLQPDPTGTGIAHQQSPRTQEPETEDIDILVGTRGPLGMCSGGRKLGRIEHDQIEGFTGLAKIAQRLKHISLQPFGSLGGQLGIERQIGARLGKCRAGGINRKDAFRPASQSLQGKTAGVIRSVKHYKSL